MNEFRLSQATAAEKA